MSSPASAIDRLVRHHFTSDGNGIIEIGDDLSARLAIQGLVDTMARNKLSHRLLLEREIQNPQHMGQDIRRLLLVGTMDLSFQDEQLHALRIRLTGMGLPVYLFHPAIIQEGIQPVDFAAVFTDGEIAQLAPGPWVSCPDIAFGLAPCSPGRNPEYDLGVFGHHGVIGKTNLAEPPVICERLQDCQRLAQQFKRIVTDDVRFAGAVSSAGTAVALIQAPQLYADWFDSHDSADLISDTKLTSQSSFSELVSLLGSAPSRRLNEICRPQRVEGFTLRDTREGQMLFNRQNNPLLVLDEQSALLWRLSNGDLSIADIAEMISVEYAVPSFTINRQLQTVFHEWLELGILAMCSADDQQSPEKIQYLFEPDGKIRRVIRVTVLPVQSVQDKCRYAAHLRCTGLMDQEIWFDVDRSASGLVTDRADPFLLAVLYIAMRHHADLWIEGAPITASLLENLDEFQEAWCCWSADLRRARVMGAEVLDSSIRRDTTALLAFSGGIDSTYSLYRHAVGPQPERTSRHPLGGVLLVHGFDVPWRDTAGFSRVRERAQFLADEARVPLLTATSNIKSVAVSWDASHALGLSAALSLFSAGFGRGLIASTMPYSLLLSHGSNPVTDWMMGSDYFSVRSDASSATRLDKIQALAHWPLALQQVRFCWKDGEFGNCGICPKCLETAILIRVSGQDPAACFNVAMDDQWIAERVEEIQLGRLERYDMQCAWHAAQSRKLDVPWLPLIERWVGSAIERS